MPTNEKEVNCILFDQLEIYEEIENELDREGIDAPGVRKYIEKKKGYIKRKLYQKPPLVEE